MSHNKLPKWKRSIVLVCLPLVAFIILFFISEMGVRLRHYIKRGAVWGIEETYHVDPESGLRVPIANMEIGSIRINSLGFRGPEIRVPKPDSTVRLAFLGASALFGSYASSNEMTWPHLVWKALKEHWPDADIDYVNGGVAGYSVTGSLKNLNYRIKKLDPDVILIYHGGNDLSGNSFRLAAERGLVERRAEQELLWPSKYSLLFYLVEKNLRIYWLQMQAAKTTGKLEFEVEELKAPYRSDLRSLVKASHESADLVVLLTLSQHIRPEQTPEERVRAAVTALYYMPYMTIDGLLAGFEAYNQVTREVAAETGSYLIGQENVIPGDTVHFKDSVHFTDEGSRVMAKRVTDALLRSEQFIALVEAIR